MMERVVTQWATTVVSVPMPGLAAAVKQVRPLKRLRFTIAHNIMKNNFEVKWNNFTMHIICNNVEIFRLFASLG